MPLFRINILHFFVKEPHDRYSLLRDHSSIEDQPVSYYIYLTIFWYFDQKESLKGTRGDIKFNSPTTTSAKWQWTGTFKRTRSANAILWFLLRFSMNDSLDNFQKIINFDLSLSSIESLSLIVKLEHLRCVWWLIVRLKIWSMNWNWKVLKGTAINKTSTRRTAPFISCVTGLRFLIEQCPRLINHHQLTSTLLLLVRR